MLAWRVNTEDQIEAEQVKKDPTKAFKFILPEVMTIVKSISHRLRKRLISTGKKLSTLLISATRRSSAHS